MHFLRVLALVVLISSTQFAHAFKGYDHCDPCYDQSSCDLCNVDFCNMEFSAYVDALYWHVCSTSSETIDSGYEWGYRVGGKAQWNAWDLSLRYTSFDASRLQELGFKANLDGSTQYKVDYSVFDLEVGASPSIYSGVLFRPFIGLKLVEIKVERLNASGFGGESTRKLKGTGLYIGMDGHWKICSFNACGRELPVAFVYRLSTGVIDGDFERRSKATDVSNLEIFEDCQFIPVHEVYTGLEFRMCGLCNMDAFMQVGYEAQYWGWVVENSNADASHLGLGGLVLRFGANF